MEWIDVYDNDFNKVASKTRQEVHKKGLFHFVFHCWVIDPSKEYIVIQQRSANKAFGGGQMDISCAGHYSSGENFESTRELYEELGIDVDYSSLTYLYDFSDHFLYGNSDDRERAKVHLLTYDLSQIAPIMVEEIENIYCCKVSDFIKLMGDELIEIPLLKLDGSSAHQTIKVADFVERREPYYSQLIEVLKHL